MDNSKLNLPESTVLRERMRRLAALDLIMCKEDWLCVHHYMPDWSEGVEVGKIDNGAGDVGDCCQAGPGAKRSGGAGPA